MGDGTAITGPFTTARHILYMAHVIEYEKGRVMMALGVFRFYCSGLCMCNVP